MNENPRIEALRRRVEKDPASIAFAQLAEEYRRGGDYQQAITICREGLARHPGYLSAQVTLGRALIELGQFDEARAELELVLRAAPDNLAAIRALAGIHEQLGDADPDLATAAVAPPPAAATPMVQHPTDPALPALEQWLAAIVADRSLSR
jgi:Flp pilus assembly protein TadD